MEIQQDEIPVEVTAEKPEKKKNILKKILISIVIILLLIIFGIVGAILLYMNSIGINHIDSENDDSGNRNDSVLYDDLEEQEKQEYYGMITAIRDDSDLSDQLYKWYSDGDHILANTVLNILIVGIDSTGGRSMHGNSDVMMLASVDKKNGRITLCSFLRDSYTYFEDSDGSGYYSKLNAAYAYGGADCLINAVENNYKIEIDYFVAVDFDAFESVIDAIGGVNIDISEKEAAAINQLTGTYVEAGEKVLLNGVQALTFSRIRSIYASGDVQRAENQRKVINAIIQKSKTLGLSDINNVVHTLGQYIYTDCPTTKIISLGTNAVLGKWYNFKVYSMEAPPDSAREAYNGSSWMWIVDYPYSAQYVQKQIYGKTNIVIQ